MSLTIICGGHITRARVCVWGGGGLAVVVRGSKPIAKLFSFITEITEGIYAVFVLCVLDNRPILNQMLYSSYTLQN